MQLGQQTTRTGSPLETMQMQTQIAICKLPTEILTHILWVKFRAKGVTKGDCGIKKVAVPETAHWDTHM